MQKTLIIGLVTLASLGFGAALTPASAATIASCRDSFARGSATEVTSNISDNSAAIIAALRDKGVNATDISDWGGCVKADVVRPNGTTAMEFFDPQSLQRLHRG